MSSTTTLSFTAPSQSQWQAKWNPPCVVLVNYQRRRIHTMHWMCKILPCWIVLDPRYQNHFINHTLSHCISTCVRLLSHRITRLGRLYWSCYWGWSIKWGMGSFNAPVLRPFRPGFSVQVFRSRLAWIDWQPQFRWLDQPKLLQYRDLLRPSSITHSKHQSIPRVNCNTKITTQGKLQRQHHNSTIIKSQQLTRHKTKTSRNTSHHITKSRQSTHHNTNT